MPNYQTDGRYVPDARSKCTVTAHVAQPRNFADGAAKAAIAGFSRQVALDLARVAEPQELAAAILFPLSGEATFVTAATPVADGGEIVA